MVLRSLGICFLALVAASGNRESLRTLNSFARVINVSQQESKEKDKPPLPLSEPIWPIVAVGVGALIVVTACWNAASGGGPPPGPPPPPPWSPIPALISSCEPDRDGHPACYPSDVAEYLDSVERSANASEEFASWIEFASENPVRLKSQEGVALLAIEAAMNHAVGVMQAEINREVGRQIRAGSFPPGISQSDALAAIHREEARLNRISEEARRSTETELFQDGDTGQPVSSKSGRPVSRLQIKPSRALEQLAHIKKSGPVKGWKEVLDEN